MKGINKRHYLYCRTVCLEIQLNSSKNQKITAFLGGWAVIFLHSYHFRILTYMMHHTKYLRLQQYNILFL